jgi:hypothetical protein
MYSFLVFWTCLAFFVCHCTSLHSFPFPCTCLLILALFYSFPPRSPVFCSFLHFSALNYTLLRYGMASSLKASRIAAAEGNEPSRNPCVRHLQQYATNFGKLGFTACKFGTNEALLEDFVEEDTELRYNKCNYCLECGQDCLEVCFAVPWVGLR